MSDFPHLPRAILFDLDDTIIRAYARPGEAWAKVLPEFAAEFGGFPADRLARIIDEESAAFWDRVAADEAHKHWRMKMPEARVVIVRKALSDHGLLGRGGMDEAFIRRLVDRFTRFRTDEMHLFPGAHETIDTLKAAGVRLALITNGDGPTQREKVVRFGLEHRFDHIQIEGEHGFGKPEERAYLHALEKLGARPGEAWMVGDNLEWEVAAPQRLGLFAIWHDAYGSGLPPDPPAHPDRIIRRLGELLEPV